MVRAGPPKRWVRKANIFKLAKGFRNMGKNIYSQAVRRVHRALAHQYTSRRLKKREMRMMWIGRINIGAREHFSSYKPFIQTLTENNILLNRKMLADLAIHEPRSFESLAKLAKKRSQDGLLAALD